MLSANAKRLWYLARTKLIYTEDGNQSTSTSAEDIDIPHVSCGDLSKQIGFHYRRVDKVHKDMTILLGAITSRATNQEGIDMYTRNMPVSHSIQSMLEQG